LVGINDTNYTKHTIQKKEQILYEEQKSEESDSESLSNKSEN